MHFFYVLYSLKDHKLYKGFSSDVGQRFQRHHQGATTSTKHRRPLVLIYVESYELDSDARIREAWAKSKEGGPALKELLRQNGILDEHNKLNLK
jgi:putative endonuclease